MKLFFLRSLAAAALACGLVACGGGDKADYEVKGTIENLKYDSLVLTNGADTLTLPGGTTKFSFPTKLAYGDIYEVKVSRKVPHQQCNVVAPNLEGVAGRDSAGRLTTIDVLVRCTIDTHTVTVAIPTPAVGAVLTNGSLGGTSKLTATTASSVFTVAYGDSYGITVLEQPTTGGPCKIENGVGVMGDDDIKNVTLRCP